MNYRIAKTNKTKQKYAQIGIQYKLYSNPEWMMLETYYDLIRNPEHYQIILCKDRGRPIGCCICDIMDTKHLVMVFVRKSCRRKGIGKTMVSLLKSENPDISDNLFSDYGVVGSELFWENVGIEMVNY